MIIYYFTTLTSTYDLFRFIYIHLFYLYGGNLI
jgi:hypothetical protein